MVIPTEEILKRVKKPTNGGEVDMGKAYESRLRILTEPKFKDDIEGEEAWKEFKKSMSQYITEAKSVRILDYMQYPLTVCNISDSIMAELYKVFDAGNSFFSVETVKKNGGEKLDKVLGCINLDRWIDEQGRRVLVNQPNTIVVVDRNEDGEAYLIPVTNERLLDFELKPDEVSLEYITFIHSKTVNDAGDEEIRIALYDDENYNVILQTKDGEHSIEKTVPHKLGYCPARMFLKQRLNSNNKLNRRSPLSLVLSKLQEWQLFDTYKFYTDHYAPFPITEMVRGKCGSENCNKGFIYGESVHFSGDEKQVKQTVTECPACKSNNQIGVGAKIIIDPVADKDEPTASGKFRMISNDITNLDYLKAKLESIEEYIKLNVIGSDNTITREAVNKDQVKGSFEKKTNVLLGIKTNLDELYIWMAQTVVKLTIGEKPVNISANFGTEWYLVGEQELQGRFKNAKEIGLPREELDLIYNQIVETKYKGNPKIITRLRIINKLNTCPYETTQEKIEKYKSGIITQKELILSEKLVSFVNRFERENGLLIEFGENLDNSQQLESILKIINSYTDGYIKDLTAQPLGSGEKTND